MATLSFWLTSGLLLPATTKTQVSSVTIAQSAYEMVKSTPVWALDGIVDVATEAVSVYMRTYGLGGILEFTQLIDDLRVAAAAVIAKESGDGLFAPAVWLQGICERVWWMAEREVKPPESLAALPYLARVFGAYAELGAGLFAVSYEDSANSVRTKAAASWLRMFYMSLLPSGAFGADETGDFGRKLRDEMDNALLAALALTSDEAKPYAAGLILSVAESTEPHVMNMNLQGLRRFFESSRLELAFSRLLTGEWYRDNAFVFMGRKFHETVTAYALLRAQFLDKPPSFTEQQLNDIRYLVNQHDHVTETLNRLHTKDLFRRTYDYRLHSWVRGENPNAVHNRLVEWWAERKQDWERLIDQMQAEAPIDRAKIEKFVRLAREGYAERRVVVRLFGKQAHYLKLPLERRRFEGKKLIGGHKLLGYTNPLPRDWFIEDSAMHTDMAAKQVGEGIATHEEYALGTKLRQLYETRQARRKRVPRISAEALARVAGELSQSEDSRYYLFTTSDVHPEYGVRGPSQSEPFTQRWQEQQSGRRGASREARTYIGRWEKDSLTVELHQLTYTDQTRLPEGVFALCKPDAMFGKLLTEDGLSVLVNTGELKADGEIEDTFIQLSKDDYPNSVEMVVTLAFEMELNPKGIVFLLPDDYSDIII